MMMMSGVLWFVLLPLLADAHSSKIQSAVLDLSDRFVDFKDQGVWLVKFYAPWCGHCKQLAPVWEQIGHALADMESPVKVAKMDCTRYTSAASAFDVRGYPTIKLFKNGHPFTYDGERSKDALIDFALKAAGPAVREVSSFSQWQEVVDLQKKRPYFAFVHGNESNVQLKESFSAVAEKYVTKAYFYAVSFSLRRVALSKLRDNTQSVVVAYKDDQVFIYPVDDDKISLDDWVNRERWPLYPKVGYGNLRDIGACCDRLLVLAVIDVTKTNQPKTDVAKFNTLMSRVAQQRGHSDGLESRFQFGWLDGPEMARSIVLGDVNSPALLVYDYVKNEFYLPDDSVTRITDDSLLVWLQQISNGERQAMGGRGYAMRIKRMAYDVITTFYNMFATQPLLTCCLFGLPAGIFAIICYSMCSADFSVEHDEVYPESEESEDESDHEKRE